MLETVVGLGVKLDRLGAKLDDIGGSLDKMGGSLEKMEALGESNNGYLKIMAERLGG